MLRPENTLARITLRNDRGYGDSSVYHWLSLFAPIARSPCGGSWIIEAARQILAAFIGRISFSHHDLHDSPFWKGSNTSYICFYDGFIPLVFEHHLSFGSVAVIKLSDSETTFYYVSKIYWLLETKIHSRCQPPLTNWAMKILSLGKAKIKMNRVIVSTDVRESRCIALRECA